ncbi:MAG: hypothetical protein RXP89_01310 [Nitrososphaeria archaeon]
MHLGEGCGEMLRELRALGFKLVLASAGDGCGAIEAGAEFRVAVYARGGRGINISRPGDEVAEVLLIELGSLDLGGLDRLLRSHPNRVRALVITFSELRELRARGRLSMRELGELFELALDRHAPLLMGSGARRREELLGPRALYSALRAIDADFWARIDYRRAVAYLYERAAMAAPGGRSDARSDQVHRGRGVRGPRGGGAGGGGAQPGVAPGRHGGPLGEAEDPQLGWDLRRGGQAPPRGRAGRGDLRDSAVRGRRRVPQAGEDIGHPQGPPGKVKGWRNPRLGWGMRANRPSLTHDVLATNRPPPRPEGRGPPLFYRSCLLCLE